MVVRRGPGVALLALIMLSGCGRAPQLGGDEATFKAVDALYTAIGLRDPALVDRSAAALEQLHAAGKLPAGAATALRGIIVEGKGGAWESAQVRLSGFMEGQRR